MRRCPHCGEKRLIEQVARLNGKAKWLCHVCAREWIGKASP